MNSEHEASPDRNITRFVLVGVVWLIVCLFSIRLRTLTFGWFVFLRRSLGQVAPRWDFLLIGCLAFCGLLFSIHFLSRNFRSQRKLSWRFSLSVSLAFLLVFISGTAMIGALHHTIWIMSERPARGSETLEVEPVKIPVISNARIAARRSMWLNQIRSLGVDHTNYAFENNGRFPPGGEFDENGNGFRSWSMMMLPGIVYANWNEEEDWRHPDNANQCKCLLPEYVRPSTDPATLFDADGFGLSEIAGNVHVLGINKSCSLQEMTDGASNTILIGEVVERLRPWCDPTNVRDPSDGINQVPWGFGAPKRQKGVFFGLCDGSVRFLSDSTDRSVLKALSTPGGGETVDF